MEEVLVTAIVFGSLIGMLKLFLDFRRDKSRFAASSGPEPSMTTSELKALISEAVEEVVDRRLDLLEHRLEEQNRGHLLPASEPKHDETSDDLRSPSVAASDRDTAL